MRVLSSQCDACCGSWGRSLALGRGHHVDLDVVHKIIVVGVPEQRPAGKCTMKWFSVGCKFYDTRSPCPNKSLAGFGPTVEDIESGVSQETRVDSSTASCPPQAHSAPVYLETCYGDVVERVKEV